MHTDPIGRRAFNRSLTFSIAALLAGRANAEEPPTSPQKTKLNSDAGIHMAVPSGPPQQIAMLLYPEFTALDLIGPHTFLAALMNVNVRLVWKRREPVALDRGNASLNANCTFAECPKDLDVLFVPGGLKGTVAAMRDPEVLDFLADRGSRAKYVTSVCTGSLLLGCAGLLRGYKATSHWAMKDLLPLVGATPVPGRVVEDRNRITGAGVTSGLDFGLTLAARMRDPQYAEMLQLVNEYDPQPPFGAGSPEKAGPTMTAHLQELLAPGVEAARVAARDSRKRWSA